MYTTGAYFRCAGGLVYIVHQKDIFLWICPREILRRKLKPIACSMFQWGWTKVIIEKCKNLIFFSLYSRVVRQNLNNADRYNIKGSHYPKNATNCTLGCFINYTLQKKKMQYQYAPLTGVCKPDMKELD